MRTQFPNADGKNLGMLAYDSFLYNSQSNFIDNKDEKTNAKFVQKFQRWQVLLKSELLGGSVVRHLTVLS